MKKFLKSTHIGNQEISVVQKHFNGITPPHFHEFYEIEYVLCGNGSYTLNGQTFDIGSGMLFFMTPLDYHSVNSKEVDIINVMFSEQFVDFSFLEPFLQCFAPKAIAVELQARPFFEMLLSEMTESEYNPQYCAALLECILLKLSHLLPMSSKQTLSKAVSQMHIYALYNFQKKVTLSAAAEYVGLTPTYASMLFKKEMQISFKEYLNSLRFDYAQKLLICSKLSVAEICLKSGFEDIPNFFRRFKIRYGVTPTQFRKDAKES